MTPLAAATPVWRDVRFIELGQSEGNHEKKSGQPVKLRPMNAFERKVIHDTIQEIGLTSESEGEDPDRCVVVLPG